MEHAEKQRKMQGILWSRDARTLDFERDKEYIINQVLRYGSMEDIAWLKSHYASEVLERVFLGHPQKIYSPEALNFVVKIILNLGDTNKIDEQRYLTVSQRNLG
ncbi:MAG: hypothetical protein WCL23_01680 [Candidatus Moraniibacteriota bacterium]